MNRPSLSVIIVIGRMRQRAARSLQAILNQKTRGAIQVIVVDTQPGHRRIPGADSPNVIYMACPNVSSLAAAKVSALARCSSEFVAFVEDHAFVSPGWAEGVISAFQTGADIVVYTYHNATPESSISRAFGLINYGRWGSKEFAGEHQDSPGNNTAYRKAALSRYEDRLVELMHIEWFLHKAIRERGGKIYQTPEAKMGHANWATLHETLLDTCTWSRLFACQRVMLEKPALGRRLVYAAVMALMPALLFWRHWQAFRPDSGLFRLFIRCSPIVLFLFLCTNISEAIGYLNPRPPFHAHLNLEVNLPRACDERVKPADGLQAPHK